jgi:[ribosomal protein S5]-alanine N-acetyltransferase
MPIIETKRLLLREFTSEDVQALAHILSDSETMRFYPSPLDQIGVVDWIERNRLRYKKDGHGLWAMVLKLTDELVGDCGLTGQVVDGNREIEIGYHVRRDWWGQGLAPEAALACQDYGFRQLSVNRLISLIRPENLPSRRVAEKMGMSLWKQVIWRNLPHNVFAVLRPNPKMD